MSKSLRAKYYPDGDPFELKNNPKSTWSWRSISSELQFVKNHSCWNLGNGKSIQIWKHRWIPELQNPPVPKQDYNTAQNYTFAHQLFTSDGKSWDVPKLQTLFCPDTVELIRSIYIHPSQSDRLIWLLEKNGIFSVKSCYKQMYNASTTIQRVDERMRKIYNRLWKLDLLPRIKQFLWKATSDLLSTKDLLGAAIVGNDDSCPLCGNQSETAAHLIMHCSFSRVVWFAVAGWTSNNAGTLSDWICSWFDCLQSRTISEKDITQRAIVAWCLWTERCAKVFQQSTSSPEVIIQKCRQYIEEHLRRLDSNPKPSLKVNRQSVHWIPPPVNYLTINCDGSFNSDSMSGGIGLILRNFAGTQQAARCIYLDKATSAEQAECMSLWTAVRWAKDLKLERVFFEMDAKVVADAVTNECNSVDWRLHYIILEMKQIFSVFSSWKLSYVPKERNKVADALANMARVDRITDSWGSVPPSAILNLLDVDSSHAST